MLFNTIGGAVFYQWLKFTALGQDAGTGVVPGPWIVVPVASTAVFLGSFFVGAILFALFAVVRPAKGVTLWDVLLPTFLLASVLFHVWVVLAVVLGV